MLTVWLSINFVRFIWLPLSLFSRRFPLSFGTILWEAYTDLARGLFGKLIGDKGYISQTLFEELFLNANLQLITRIKSNMKNKLISVFDKILLRKRSIIETVIDQLKNISQIEHSRHRSPTNFLANLVCGFIAYCRQPKKPSLGFLNLFSLLTNPD